MGIRRRVPPDLNAAPVEPLLLDAEDVVRNMCCAKRGAAGGPLSSSFDFGVRV